MKNHIFINNPFSLNICITLILFDEFYLNYEKLNKIQFNFNPVKKLLNFFKNLLPKIK